MGGWVLARIVPQGITLMEILERCKFSVILIGVFLVCVFSLVTELVQRAVGRKTMSEKERELRLWRRTPPLNRSQEISRKL